MRLCKDCRYYEENTSSPPHSKCGRPVSGKYRVKEPINLITGQNEVSEEDRGKHRWRVCSVQRQDNWYWSRVFNSCGKRGRFFEPQVVSSSRAFRVKDGVGRTWVIPETEVRENYIQFLMGAEDLSRIEAQAKADSPSGKAVWGLDGYGFAQQIADNPAYAFVLGGLVQDISAQQKEVIVHDLSLRMPLTILHSD